ncbi:MAG TPA: cytochrome c3 family protein [Myxococcales bacterium]|nr:cytochrome c3 family protein [Myxococcales bacterium]
METLPRSLAALVLLASLVGGPAAAGDAPETRPGSSTVPRAKPLSLAPVKARAALSTHSPYEVGDCSLCHQRKNPRDPGPVSIAGDKGCTVCHEEFLELAKSRRFKHAPGKVGCIGCHNPHNASVKGLLLRPAPALCLECHTGITAMMNLQVKHAAVTQDASCMNCHDPHASNVEHLLSRLPFDQCVQCHGKDGITDSAGAKLTNIGTLLEQNKVHHGPVAQKDCSACHQPHGSAIFRLLRAPYPATFYAPFEVKTYEMCFGCHDEQLVTAERTTTATRFRDGDRNLHFLHVNKPDRGRTCRACHEVHASQKVYQIRESVPFGSRGYLLKVNFVKRADGGDCTQTCHTARAYSNVAPAAVKAR